MPLSHRRARVFRHCLLSSFLLACGPDAPVGVGAALSGPFVNAARLAVEEASMTGGLPPLDTVMLSEFSNRAALALELVDSFLARPHMLGVVGHSNSAASMATAPLYNANRIVQIAPTSTAVAYSQSGPFSFRMVPADSEQGGFLAHALDSLYPAGARLAVMFVNDDYGRGLRTALLAQLDSTRFPVVFQQPHTDEEFVSPPPDRARRVRTTITSMLELQPGVLLWLGRATTFHHYLLTLRELNDSLPVLGGDALASWHSQDSGRGEWRGVRHADFLDLEASEALHDFRRRYSARFGVPAGTPEVLSYDAMQLLLAAIRDGARTGEEARRWLSSLGQGRPPFQGISGPISFDVNGDIARSYVLVTMVPPARADPP